MTNKKTGEGTTRIEVKRSTAMQLNKMKKFGESYDKLIRRLIDVFRKKNS